MDSTLGPNEECYKTDSTINPNEEYVEIGEYFSPIPEFLITKVRVRRLYCVKEK